MIETPAIYIGLGSNLGDRLRSLRNGLHALRKLPNIRLQACSPVYVTAPIGFEDQPDFYNAVCGLHCSLPPMDLMQALLEIEQDLGRRRQGPAGGPRTLDLDLLLYGQMTLQTDNTVVPHPRLHERAFVLYPLRDIAPGLEIPGKGAVNELLARCRDQKVERLADTLSIPSSVAQA